MIVKLKKHSIQLKFILILTTVIICHSSCNKQLDKLRPHNVIFEDRQFDSPEGYSKAVVGIYNLIAGSATPSGGFNFNDMLIFLSEGKGNTIKALDAGTNKNSDLFNYTNSSSKDLSHTYDFWRAGYNTILHINKVLSHINENETNNLILQAKAEALFLRAYTYFNLVRLYGKPYYQDADKSLGVMLVLSDNLSSDAAQPRATVAETYAQIIQDLSASIQYFKASKSNSYASANAAYALLSRVYLYKGGTYNNADQEANEQVVAFTTKVIEAGAYKLLEGNEFLNYYKTDNLGNKEDIFAINTRFTQGSISSLFAMPSQINYSGGNYRPSPYLLNLIEPDDLRNNFYVKNLTPGNQDDNRAVSKYMLNYVSIYSISPLRYLRLAEMYLNRAEAYLKLKRQDAALADVNSIRKRAGLAVLSGLSDKELMDEIIKQRKIELAFEGHASFDDFRNGLDMVRNYDSGGSAAMVIKATDSNAIMMLPEEEIKDNPKLQQNK